VVVLHVLPGIIPGVVRFADRVTDAGFTVFMPHLFGVPGKPLARGYLYAQAIRVCLRREFHALAARKASPVTEWLRALCRHAHQACSGPGVGVVGMCFTGGFALATMLEPAVMAPVICQPVLPNVRVHPEP
jgi:dienelactone hydrolase